MPQNLTKTKLSKFIAVYIVIAIIFVFSFSVIIFNRFENHSLSIILLFTAITVFSIFMLFKDVIQRAYSLSMMYWFFGLMFFGVAGFYQYLNDAFVYSINVPDNLLQYILILIIIWFLCFYLGTSKIFRSKHLYIKASKLLYKPIYMNDTFIIVCTIVSLGIALYAVTYGGFTTLLSRNTAGIIFRQDTLAETQLFSAFLRNFVLYSFAIAIVFGRTTKRLRILILLQGICLLTVNPIFGMARFNIAIVYFGLFLILFPSLKRTKYFIGLFFLAFILAFPMINIFRYISLTDVSMAMLVNTIHEVGKNFLHGDYDAFSMLVNTNIQVKTYGLSWGYQLIGALLFFVPRSLWEVKPIGSGAMVRTSQGEIFTNVSCPLIAESFINFGLAGIMVFGYIIGRIVSLIDGMYWMRNQRTSVKEYTYIDIIYPFLLPMFFFMNRGDLMSTFSFAMSHIVVFSILLYINNYLPRFRFKA